MPINHPMVTLPDGRLTPPPGFEAAPALLRTTAFSDPDGAMALALPGCICVLCVHARQLALARCPLPAEWEPEDQSTRAMLRIYRATFPGAPVHFYRSGALVDLDRFINQSEATSAHAANPTGRNIDGRGWPSISPWGLPLDLLRPEGLLFAAANGWGRGLVTDAEIDRALGAVGAGRPRQSAIVRYGSGVWAFPNLQPATPLYGAQSAPWAYALMSPHMLGRLFQESAGKVLVAYGGCSCFACVLVRAMAVSQGLLLSRPAGLFHNEEAMSTFARMRAVAGHWSDALAISAHQNHTAVVTAAVDRPTVWFISNLIGLCAAVPSTNFNDQERELSWEFFNNTFEVPLALRGVNRAEVPQRPTREEPRSRTPALALRQCGLVTPRFGVELECIVPTHLCGLGDMAAQRYLANVLSEAGIASQPERYNHDHRAYWKITTDGSIVGNGAAGAEVVTPALADFDELRQGMRALARSGARVNKSCGCHVHFDAADFTLASWKRLLLIYAAMEPAIDSFMPPSRRESNNQFCMSLRSASPTGYAGFKKELNRRTSLRAIADDLLQGSRYWKVNPRSWWAHGTVEFRQFGATLNYGKVRRWIILLDSIVSLARDEGAPLPAESDDLEAALGHLAGSREALVGRVGLALPGEPGRLGKNKQEAWKKLCDGTARLFRRSDVEGLLGSTHNEFREHISPRAWKDLGDGFMRAVEPQLVDNLLEAGSFFCERANEFKETEEWTNDN